MRFGHPGIAEPSVIALAHCPGCRSEVLIERIVLGKGRLCADSRWRWLVARGILLHIVDITKPHVCLVRLIALVEHIKSVKGKFFSK